MFGGFFGKINFIEKIAKILSIFAFYLLIFWYYNLICFLTGAEMENIFSDKTETALIAERSAISAATPVDETALRLLENEAMRRILFCPAKRKSILKTRRCFSALSRCSEKRKIRI